MHTNKHAILFACLKSIFSYLNFKAEFDSSHLQYELNLDNIQAQSEDFGLLLNLMSVNSWKDIDKTIYPILLELSDGSIWVSFPRGERQKLLYNPQDEVYTSIKSVRKNLQVARCWQCSSFNANVPKNYIQLIKFVYTYFKVDFLKVCLINIIISIAIVFISIMSANVFKKISLKLMKKTLCLR